MLNVDSTNSTVRFEHVSVPMRAVYPQQEFAGTSYFDYMAELHMSAHQFHPADVSMAAWFTNSYARKLARVAGEPLPERGLIPDSCRDIFRYNLMKAHMVRQARAMEVLTHPPVLFAN